MHSKTRVPFDPETQTLFCSACGSRLEKSAHMFYEFMMCPRHGEFTLAPTVMREPDDGKWYMLTNETTASMWQTCIALDARHADGSPVDPRESRVLFRAD